MSRYAVISDIHGNLHAFQAVLHRIADLHATRPIDGVICLGDVVGYGPHPDACLDLVYKHCDILVQGNHDAAIIDPDTARTFNGPARDALHWTRQHLGPLHLNAINKMTKCADVSERLMCIHASPAPGPSDYIHDKIAAAIAFTGVSRQICLIGHTHVPMIFETTCHDASTMDAFNDIIAYLPGDGIEHDLDPECRYICNPGSVGQPRDCDPRASFGILDLGSSTYTVHRQEYDICAAQKATQDAGLPTVLAQRLAIGA